MFTADRHEHGSPQSQLAKRRIALVALGVYDLSRAFAYSPFFGRGGQSAIIDATLGGAVLPVWVVLWALAGILCFVCVPSARLVWAVSVSCGLMVGWGAMWLVGWLIAPESLWWQTFLTYWGPAVAIGALLGLVTPRPRRAGPDGG